MTTQHPVVCFGEILWDVLPSGIEPGGAPMNVAYHLRKLNIASALITRVGTDDYGKALAALLTQQNIGTEYLQIDIHHPTGLVYAQPNERGDMQYDIVYPSAWDFIEYSEGYIPLLQQAEYLVYGSLITRNETSKNTLLQLMPLAKKRVLDINLRPPHFTKEVVEQLFEKVDMLKLNADELQLISSWYGSANNIYDDIKLLQDKFHIPIIVVTRGSEGAILNDNGNIYEHNGYQVIVGDTVGSGDAFLAGLLYQYLQQAPPDEALDFACATGALIAAHHGACPQYELSEIVELLHSKQ